MSYTVVFKEEADSDVFDARSWYESRRIGLGDEFLEEIEEYVKVLEQDPQIFQITESRPTILKEITAPRPARKPTKINHLKIENHLFISINGSENIKNSLLHMFKDIQKINPNITNA